jgi:hypothetical protein
MPYEWKDDARYEYEQDSDSDVVRFEISLCFGRHKSRESCSDKVDSMLGKLAREVGAKTGIKNNQILQWYFLIGNSPVRRRSVSRA